MDGVHVLAMISDREATGENVYSVEFYAITGEGRGSLTGLSPFRDLATAPPV